MMPSKPCDLRALLFALASLLLAAGCSPPEPVETAPAPTTAPDATVLRAAAEAHLTRDLVFEHLAWLASDEMRGRDTPSPELELAAEYIADHFRTVGVEPAGDGPDDYMQRWPFERLVFDAGASVASATGPDYSRELEYGTDFFAIPGSATPMEGAPFYLASPSQVGTGLPAEAAGRPVMVHLPDGLGPEFGMVVQAAMGAGASGVILLMDRDSDAADIFQTAGALEAGAAGMIPFPVVGVRYEVGAEILASAEVEPEGGRDPPAVLHDLSFEISTHFDSTVDQVPNVVGIIRGSDPELADSHIVLTAHFDHVGVGPPDARGDSIFNGADDNASGTAVLMQVAEALAALPEPPARSVLFLAVSGEEKGLLGSAYFANAPTIPAGSMVANLNMDMVSRNDPDTVFAIGEAYSTLGTTLEEIVARHPELGLVAAPDPVPEEELFLRSDHFSFVEIGVPAMMFTTLLHDDYHLQSDTPERTDPEKAARIGRLIFYLTHALANDPEVPEWTDEGRAVLDALP